MKTIILGSNIDLLNNAATEYNFISGGQAWNATQDNRRQIVPAAGNFRNLRIKLSAAPGAGTIWTFTLMVNGAASSMAVAISGASDTTGSYTSDVAISAGDMISLRAAGTSSPLNSFAKWSIEFEGSTAGQSIILGGLALNNVDSVTRYCNLGGIVNANGTAENQGQQPIPTAGTIKNLYVRTNSAPGGGGLTLTVRKNGSSAGCPTVTLTTGDNDSDLANSIAVSAGDLVAIEITTGAITNSFTWWSCVFEPTTDGEALLLGGRNDVLSSDPEYNYIAGGFQTWRPDEPDRLQISDACRIKNLYLQTILAPGAGTSLSISLRDDGSTTALVATVSGTGTQGNSGATEVVVERWSEITLLSSYSGSPTFRAGFWGAVILHGRGLSLSCSPGSFSLTGIDATLTYTEGGEAILTAEAGSFSLTGVAAGLEANRKLVTEAGSFTLTGIDAGLLCGRIITAAAGTFTLTGVSAGLICGRLITASPGTFVLTGISSALYVGRLIDCDVGEFALTGIDAEITKYGITPRLEAEAGSFSLIGVSAGLLYNRIMPMSAGVFTLTGIGSGLYVARLLACAEGEFVLTGIDANITVPLRLGAETGLFALTGISAELYADRVISAAAGVFIVTGKAAGLTLPLIKKNILIDLETQLNLLSTNPPVGNIKKQILEDVEAALESYLG